MTKSLPRYIETMPLLYQNKVPIATKLNQKSPPTEQPVFTTHALSARSTQLGIALPLGLVVLAMIHSFGDVSVARLSPAATFGF